MYVCCSVKVHFPFRGRGLFFILVTEVDEEKFPTSKWKMYFNGAANEHGCGIGAVLISPEGDQYPASARLTFPYTNNIAEYEACIMGLNMAIDMEIEDLEAYGDSSPIIFQTRGEYRTKDPKLVPYHQHLSELVKRFKDISFTYIPRTQNQFTDALATLASMIQITKESGVQPLRVGVEEEPAFCLVIKETLEEGPWYQDIKTYLQTGAYPENASRKDQKTLRRLASKFILSGNTLYNRSFDSTLMRCVDEKEAELLMKEVHEGVCGPHMNGYMLTRKIMRQG